MVRSELGKCPLYSGKREVIGLKQLELRDQVRMSAWSSFHTNPKEKKSAPGHGALRNMDPKRASSMTHYSLKLELVTGWFFSADDGLPPHEVALSLGHQTTGVFSPWDYLIILCFPEMSFITYLLATQCVCDSSGGLDTAYDSKGLPSGAEVN